MKKGEKGGRGRKEQENPRRTLIVFVANAGLPALHHFATALTPAEPLLATLSPVVSFHCLALSSPSCSRHGAAAFPTPRECKVDPLRPPRQYNTLEHDTLTRTSMRQGTAPILTPWN